MHTRHFQCRIAVVVVSLSAVLLCPPHAGAQTADPNAKPPLPGATAVHSPVRKSTPTKSANVKSGVIAAVDAAAETLTLRERTGKSAVYVLTAKTHFNKGRRAVQAEDFKVGDAAVVHFRKSRTDGALLLTELDDPVSWIWLSELRKTTTAATIKEITEDTLSVTVSADNVPMDYTISDKTRWEKAGKEADPSAFKDGDHVFIVPRSLPSGAVMARAVSDSTQGAAQEKERLAPSVHGTIVTIDPAAHKLVLRTLAGDVRNLAYTDELEIVSNGKQAQIGALRPGLRVVARIRHGAGGDEIVWRFTVDTLKKVPTPKKRAPAAKGV